MIYRNMAIWEIKLNNNQGNNENSYHKEILLYPAKLNLNHYLFFCSVNSLFFIVILAERQVNYNFKQIRHTNFQKEIRIRVLKEKASNKKKASFHHVPQNAISQQCTSKHWFLQPQSRVLKREHQLNECLDY